MMEMSKQLIRGYKIEELLGYFPLRNFGRIMKSGANDWSWKPSNQEVDGHLLNQWMIELGNMTAVDEDGEFNTPFALVGLTPGNSAEFNIGRTG